MSLAISVAKEFLRLADLDGDPLTKMQLQKLMYYAQAWSMTIRDADLFDENFEAWIHGPVNRELHDKYSSVKGTIVPVTENEFDWMLSKDDLKLIKAVWDSYSDLSASALRKKTHEDLPWKEARKGLPEEAPSSLHIDANRMVEFYSTQKRPTPIAAFEEWFKRREKEAQAWYQEQQAAGLFGTPISTGV